MYLRIMVLVVCSILGGPESGCFHSLPEAARKGVKVKGVEDKPGG